MSNYICVYKCEIQQSSSQTTKRNETTKGIQSKRTQINIYTTLTNYGNGFRHTTNSIYSSKTATTTATITHLFFCMCGKYEIIVSVCWLCVCTSQNKTKDSWNRKNNSNSIFSNLSTVL